MPSTTEPPSRPRSATPMLDKLGIAMGLIALLMVPTVMLRNLSPETFEIIRSKTHPACGSLEAWRGLRKHRRIGEAAGNIKLESVVLRSDGGYILWQTPQGSYWVPDLTSEALFALLSQQQYDIYESPESHVQPGDVVLDCGAHIGVFTRLALKRGAAKVIAIEPAPENLECLRRNFRQEIGDGRVVVYPKGVWNKDEVLPMNMNRNSAGDSFVLNLDPGQNVVNLPLTTIDKIASELGLSKVHFIKMDIKGAEVKALEGARDVLAKYKPRIAVASEHLDDDPVRIPETILTGNPGYRIQCGACYAGAGTVRPEVLHFY